MLTIQHWKNYVNWGSHSVAKVVSLIAQLSTGGSKRCDDQLL